MRDLGLIRAEISFQIQIINKYEDLYKMARNEVDKGRMNCLRGAHRARLQELKDLEDLLTENGLAE